MNFVLKRTLRTAIRRCVISPSIRQCAPRRTFLSVVVDGQSYDDLTFKIFDRLDTNHNGYIEQWEIDTLCENADPEFSKFVNETLSKVNTCPEKGIPLSQFTRIASEDKQKLVSRLWGGTSVDME